jgi:ketosteroid isomerase-like protein
MSRYLKLMVALVTSLLAIWSAQSAFAEDFESQVKSAYAAWDAAFNKQDAKTLGGFYTEDAYLLPPSHKVIRGPSGVQEFFTGLFSGGVKDHKLELIKADGDGKLVFAAAKWSASGKDDKGQPAQFSGIATHIFEKQADGSLKLKLQTFN